MIGPAEIAWQFIWEAEGIKPGEVITVSGDPGGATGAGGITLRTAKTSKDEDGNLKFDLNHDGKVDIEDLKLITSDIAKDEFKVYWQTIQGDRFPGVVSILLADIAWNSGPVSSALLLQKVVGAKQDGIIGEETIQKALAWDKFDLLLELSCERLRLLKRLAWADKFVVGWRNRMKRMLKLQVEEL